LMNAVSVFQLENEGQSKRTADRRVTPNPMRAHTKKAAPRLVETKPAKSGTDDSDWEEF